MLIDGYDVYRDCRHTRSSAPETVCGGSPTRVRGQTPASDLLSGTGVLLPTPRVIDADTPPALQPASQPRIRAQWAQQVKRWKRDMELGESTAESGRPETR